MRTAGYSFLVDRVIRVCLHCATVHRYKSPVKDSGGAILFVTERIAAEKRFIDFDAVKSGITQECHGIDQRVFPEEILQ